MLISCFKFTTKDVGLSLSGSAFCGSVSGALTTSYYLVAGPGGAGVQGGPLHGPPLRLLRQRDEDQGICTGKGFY